MIYAWVLIYSLGGKPAHPIDFKSEESCKIAFSRMVAANGNNTVIRGICAER